MSGIMASLPPLGWLRLARAPPGRHRVPARRKAAAAAPSLGNHPKGPHVTEAALPVFDAPYAEDDAAIAARLLGGARLEPARERRIDATARRLVRAIRARRGGL